MIKKLGHIFLLSLTLCGVVGCSESDEGKRTLVMGTSLDYPPFEFSESGEARGLDIDLAKAIVKEMGYELEIKDMAFTGLMGSLKSGRVDFLMSGLGITPERAANVDFSNPYFEMNEPMTVISKKDAPINNEQEFAGKKIGVQLSSIGEVALNEIMEEVEGVTPYPLDLNLELVESLKIGHIDGIVISENQSRIFTSKNPELKYERLKRSGQMVAAAFQKGSPLVQEYNGALERVKSSGVHEKILKKWYEGNDAQEGKGWVVFILKGIGTTLGFTAGGIGLGLVIGIGLVLMRETKVGALELIAKAYISVFRGTPLLVQLGILFYGIPSVVDIKLNVWQAGILAFGMNSAAYVAEIIRSGVNSVDKGQFEAARALAVPYTKMMRDIILPQALANILPALMNEFINLLKETAIVSVIGGLDLMRRAQLVAAENYSYFEPLMIAAITYYCIVMILTSIASVAEKKLKAA